MYCVKLVTSWDGQSPPRSRLKPFLWPCKVSWSYVGDLYRINIKLYSVKCLALLRAVLIAYFRWKKMSLKMQSLELLGCFFLGGSDFCTQDFELAKQVLCSLSHASSLILLWLFWRWSLENYFLGVALTLIFEISASQVDRITVWVTSAQGLTGFWKTHLFSFSCLKGGRDLFSSTDGL
jgi:hypothetical protein